MTHKTILKCIHIPTPNNPNVLRTDKTILKYICTSSPNNPNVQRTGEIILLEMVIVDVISNFLGCIIVGIGAGEVAASTL